MSAANIVNALLVLNEAALTAEQLASLFARVRSGEVPTEEEIDEMIADVRANALSELERIGRAPD